jgi:hypothetical protein
MTGTGSTRGWTDSKLKLTEIQLLDRVHQATSDGEALRSIPTPGIWPATGKRFARQPTP